MLNNYNVKNNTDISINACSGGIYKSYKESWFLRFHLESPLSKQLLSSNPEYTIHSKNKGVILLQMVICGDMQVIAELILKEDFDKHFTKGEER